MPTTLFVVLIGGGLIAAALWQSAEARRLRQPLADAVPELVDLEEIDDTLLADKGIPMGEDVEGETPPEGQIRGKCLLVDFDPETRAISLHRWHHPSMKWTTAEWGLLAASPNEVETICLLNDRHVEMGEYRGLLGGRRGGAFDHVITTTIVNRESGLVVGQFTMREEAPSTTKNDRDIKAHISDEDYLERLRVARAFR